MWTAKQRLRNFVIASQMNITKKEGCYNRRVAKQYYFSISGRTARPDPSCSFEPPSRKFLFPARRQEWRHAGSRHVAEQILEISFDGRLGKVAWSFIQDASRFAQFWRWVGYCVQCTFVYVSDALDRAVDEIVINTKEELRRHEGKK